ncbi:MAG: hypothetical protein LBL05_05140 [Synergistaceae bacterium]|jgi:hypothetical protein|nr:hypothetical protein [Synergistaceae bacterium]
MAYLELVRCRLAIQCCIGYFPDGRKRHRTFSLPDVRPGASADALASVVRAVAPLLKFPITRVRVVKKYVLTYVSGESPSERARMSGRTLIDGPDAYPAVSPPLGSARRDAQHEVTRAADVYAIYMLSVKAKQL